MTTERRKGVKPAWDLPKAADAQLLHVEIVLNRRQAKKILDVLTQSIDIDSEDADAMIHQLRSALR